MTAPASAPASAGLKPDVVLYGALRSGTTLLRLMVDAHPQLSCPGETDFIFDYLPPGATPQTPYNPTLLETDRICRAHMEKFADTPLEEPTAQGFLDQIRSRGDVAVLIMHRRLERLLEVYPDIPIIHMVRDPRDVARSSIGMGWARDVYQGAWHWIRTEGEWHGLADKISPDQVLRITYEALIQEPEATLTQICDFVGVAYDPAMLSYDADSNYGKPDPSLTEQWRRKLSPYEIGLVEGRVGPLLEQSGYAPSGHPVVVPEGLERQRIIWRNKLWVWAKRIELYGLRDPLIDALQRRFGFPNADAARQRMDAIKSSDLK